MTDLTLSECKSLSKLEDKISRAFRTFYYEVGAALREINTRSLYRQDYPSFEQYLIDRWDLKKTSGYQLISAANTYDLLKESGAEILPEKESHVRPLTALPEEKQIQAWREISLQASSSNKRKISTELVAEVVRKIRERHQTESPEQPPLNLDLNRWIYIGKKILPLGGEEKDLYPFDLLNSTEDTDPSSPMVSVRKSGHNGEICLPSDQLRLLPKIGEWIKYQNIELRIVNLDEFGLHTQSSIVPLGGDWEPIQEPSWHNSRAQSQTLNLNNTSAILDLASPETVSPETKSVPILKFPYPYQDRVLEVLGENITWISDIEDFLTFPDKFCFFPPKDWRWDLLEGRLSAFPEGILFTSVEKWRLIRPFELRGIAGHSIILNSLKKASEEIVVVYCCSTFSLSRLEKMQENFSPFFTYEGAVFDLIKEISKEEE